MACRWSVPREHKDINDTFYETVQQILSAGDRAAQKVDDDAADDAVVSDTQAEQQAQAVDEAKG